MTGWWREFGGARFGRPSAPPPVARPALLARLDRALAGGTVVVTAGAGAGKSTLLAAWSGERSATLVRLPEAGDPATSVRLAEAGDPAVPLVFDGVDSTWSGWRRWVGVRPLVLSGREPLDVAGAVVFGDADLAFGEDESYQVLAAALGDAADADELAPDLHLLTNGWPALVGLAAAFLARLVKAERNDGLRQLTRIEGLLHDPLVAALIGVLRPDEQELLRRLAHLPAVDAATADALDLTENLCVDVSGMPQLVRPVPGRPGFYAVPEEMKPAIRKGL